MKIITRAILTPQQSKLRAKAQIICRQTINITRVIHSTRRLTKRLLMAGLLAHASQFRQPSQKISSGILALTQHLQLRGQLWLKTHVSYQIPILSLKKSSKHHKHLIIKSSYKNIASKKNFFSDEINNYWKWLYSSIFS